MNPRVAVDVPVGALVLLVGPAGAGKSTWAAGRFAPQQILESDRFRELVAGDAADQAASADAFKALHVILRARLRRGLTTVVDATNLTAGARRTSLRLARQAGRPAVAIVFDVSLERCLRQNAARSVRSVPQAVVRRHQRALREALGQLPAEGFAEIVRLEDVDMDER